MNSLSITGRLTGNYEVSYLPNGNAVGKFSLAVNDGWGENKHTSFFDIVVFGKRADKHGDFIGKGSLVGLECRIQQRRWDAQDGSKRSKVELVANKVEYLDSKPKETETINDNGDVPF